MALCKYHCESTILLIKHYGTRVKTPLDGVLRSNFNDIHWSVQQIEVLTFLGEMDLSPIRHLIDFFTSNRPHHLPFTPYMQISLALKGYYIRCYLVENH